MTRGVVAVALAVLVVLAGCGAIDINRPADEEANETDAQGGPGAPTENGTDGDRTADDGDEQAAEGETLTATATPAPTEGAASDRDRIRLDGVDEEYVVSLTVTKGPIEAVKLDGADGETDVVPLEGRPVARVLASDTVDVRPIEVVEATAEYEVDPGESTVGTLPHDDRRHVLLELATDDGRVVDAAVLSCARGESVGDVSVTADGGDLDATSRCLG